MHKESRTDRWLRTVFVLFLVVLVLLIVFNGTTKTSDVSNWIIAFANIAMAAAAVGAWRAARKFLSEFFAQEGYRLAIALINENVIHLGIDMNLPCAVRTPLWSASSFMAQSIQTLTMNVSGMHLISWQPCMTIIVHGSEISGRCHSEWKPTEFMQRKVKKRRCRRW